MSPLLKATRELPNADCARMLTSGLRVRQGELWKENRHLPPSIGGCGLFGQRIPLDGKPKRDRQHHSLSKNSSRRVVLNGPPRPATASPNVPPLNRRQATRHDCASVRMSWSSGAVGALTEGSSNCGHQIPRVGRKSLPGSTLERVRRPIAGSILRTGPERSLVSGRLTFVRDPDISTARIPGAVHIRFGHGAWYRARSPVCARSSFPCLLRFRRRSRVRNWCWSSWCVRADSRPPTFRRFVPKLGSPHARGSTSSAGIS